MAINQMQVTNQVREIVALLMKRPITETVAMQVARYEGFAHLEIANGEWVNFEQDEYMTGEEHSWIETKILTAIASFVMDNQLGRVYPGDMDFVLSGDRENLTDRRQPDVAFVQHDHVQKTSGYFYGAPDLAVEIVSPSQDRPEFVQKANLYLQYGTQQVWLVFPRKQQIEIHTANAIPKVYSTDDSVPGGDLLPGFSLEVKAIFD